MPIMDAKQLLSDSQDITATADSTNVIDLGAGKDFAFNDIAQDYGEQGRQFLNVTVGDAFVGGTSVAFELQESDAVGSGFAALAVPKSPITRAAIVVASLVAGFKVLRVPLPAGIKRFVKMKYTVVGSPTPGSINAWIGSQGQ